MNPWTNHPLTTRRRGGWQKPVYPRANLPLAILVSGVCWLIIVVMVHAAFESAALQADIDAGRVVREAGR